MEVFLQIRRNKTTIFLIGKENTSVKELKLMLNGVTMTPAVEHINLFNVKRPWLMKIPSLTMASVCKAQPGELVIVMSFKDEPAQFAGKATV